MARTEQAANDIEAAAPDRREPFSRRLLLGHGLGAALLLHDGLAEALPSPRTPTERRPVIVLDPGHGGEDIGAVGVGGACEKHVAYAAATELQRQLLATGRYQVNLTRAGDEYVPLADRIAIAEALGAALFCSIHADALSDRAARGASVYTFAETASDAASAARAARENADDRVQIRPGSLMRHEVRLGSARLQSGVISALGAATVLLPQPARHAAFAVLRAPAIPSVLVELGADEAALRRADHRALIASAVRRGVDRYFMVEKQALLF